MRPHAFYRNLGASVSRQRKLVDVELRRIGREPEPCVAVERQGSGQGEGVRYVQPAIDLQGVARCLADAKRMALAVQVKVFVELKGRLQVREVNVLAEVQPA